MKFHIFLIISMVALAFATGGALADATVTISTEDDNTSQPTQTIDQHTAIVEKDYSNGHMRLVIESSRLQRVIDNRCLCVHAWWRYTTDSGTVTRRAQRG